MNCFEIRTTTLVGSCLVTEGRKQSRGGGILLRPPLNPRCDASKGELRPTSPNRPRAPAAAAGEIERGRHTHETLARKPSTPQARREGGKAMEYPAAAAGSGGHKYYYPPQHQHSQPQALRRPPRPAARWVKQWCVLGSSPSPTLFLRRREFPLLLTGIYLS